MSDNLIPEIHQLVGELKGEVSGIHNELKRLNGDVAANKKFRYLLLGGFITMNIIVVPILVAIIIKLFN